MTDQINYDKVLTSIEKTISTSSFYWQSLSLIVCFVVSYFFYKLSKKFLFPQIISPSLKENPRLNQMVVRYVAPILYPLFAVVFLAIGLLIYSQFFNETIVFTTTLKLMALLLFLRFLRISSGSTLVANLAGLVLMPMLILDIFGALDSTIAFLDEFALKIGKVRISIYLVLKALVVLLTVFWLSNLVSRKSKFYIDSSSSIKSSTKNIISKIIDILIYTIVIIVLLQIFGVDMTTLAVIGGAIGVGVGFGLQKIASNFISGIILLFEKSVEVGDIVELNGGDIYGTVKHFSGRYTLIEASDGKEILIPNEEFIINRVTNWTYSNNRARIEINVGVAYGSDLKKVQNIMIDCAKSHPRCLSYPEVECFLTSFGEYDVKFTLHFWIGNILDGRSLPKSEVMMKIWEKFQENGIEIPVLRKEFLVS